MSTLGFAQRRFLKVSHQTYRNRWLSLSLFCAAVETLDGETIFRPSSATGSQRRVGGCRYLLS